jgi:O-antigen/teichoic acid export membrane protein
MSDLILGFRIFTYQQVRAAALLSVDRKALKFPPGRHLRSMGRVSRRLSWGVADQGMSSLTNFLLSAFVARSLGAAEFGAFSLAYVTYGLGINASRGLAVEPLLIRFSGTGLPAWRRACAGAAGSALLVGIAGGLLGIVAGVLVGGTTGQAFIALGVTLPGLLLQDSWRYAFFAVGKGYHAFINDTVWAAVQIPLLILLKVTGHAEVFWFVIAWGGAACVGAVLGSVQARVLPSLRQSVHWLRRHRDLGPRYLVENTGGNAVDSLRAYSVTRILGLAAVGLIQAAGVLMGPFKIIYYGISLITIPEAARLLRRSPRLLSLFCVVVSGGLTVLALAWGLALLIALPHGLGHLMLGNLWRPTYPLVLPTMFSVMAMCAGTGANVGLHALGAARRSMRNALRSAVIIVAGAIIGALVAGTLGSVWFAAAGSWIGVLIAWWQLKLALHESGLRLAGDWLRPGQAAAAPDAAAPDIGPDDGSGPAGATAGDGSAPAEVAEPGAAEGDSSAAAEVAEPEATAPEAATSEAAAAAAPEAAAAGASGPP